MKKTAYSLVHFPLPKASQLPSIYLQITKSKLSLLVNVTTIIGYSLAQATVSIPTLLSLTVGTHFCIASANTFNQWMEVPYDAVMKRTCNRPLVRDRLSPFHALFLGVGTGIAGVAILATQVNTVTAVLGLLNIGLYAGVYTPLKRKTIYNTWVGAIVGGIPPVMGWTAATNSIDLSALSLGMILFLWQFPHFCALSHRIRSEYSNAGYKMLAENPLRNSRVSLLYTIGLFPTILMIVQSGICGTWLLASSSVVNGWMGWRAWNFYRAIKKGNNGEKEAKSLFWASLVHLPVLMALLLLHKKGKKDEQAMKEEEAALSAVE